MSPSRQHSKPLSNFPANSCVEGSGIPGPKALPWSDLRENENRCLPPTSWGRNQFIAAIKTVSSVCLGLNLCWALSVTSGRGACRRPLGSFPVGLYRNGGGLAVNTTWITWCAPRRDEDSGFACHCVCLKVWDNICRAWPEHWSCSISLRKSHTILSLGWQGISLVTWVTMCEPWAF